MAPRRNRRNRRHPWYFDTTGASHVHDASHITTGVFTVARIPSLDASIITTGTFGDAFLSDIAASKVTAGTFPDAYTFAGRLTLTNLNDVNLSGVSGVLIIGGDGTFTHIAIDSNEIMAKSSATTASTLFLQADGGHVNIGGVIKLTTLNINVGDFILTPTSLALDVEVDTTEFYKVDGTQVVSTQEAAVANASGGATIWADGFWAVGFWADGFWADQSSSSVDGVARTAINNLLARLRSHGLIAT